MTFGFVMIVLRFRQCPFAASHRSSDQSRFKLTDFGNLQKELEAKKLNVISAEFEWIPSTTVPVTDEQAEDISKLIERLEEDEDVNKVFHNMG